MHGSPHVVGDVMTRSVVAVGRDASFKEVVTTMEEWKVGGPAVCQRLHDRHLPGETSPDRHHARGVLVPGGHGSDAVQV